MAKRDLILLRERPVIVLFSAMFFKTSPQEAKLLCERLNFLRDIFSRMPCPMLSRATLSILQPLGKGKRVVLKYDEAVFFPFYHQE